MSNQKIPTDSDFSDTSRQAPDHERTQTINPDPPVGSTPPTTGPEFFEQRRAQWRMAQPKSTPTPSPTTDSTSHARLEAVVSTPGYESDDVVWDTYLKSVNERLKAGVTLRKPLPLWVVIRVLRAGWMRDGTWFGPNPPPIQPPAALGGTSSAMTETPALTPTAFLNELSAPPSTNLGNPPPTGRVYATRRTRTPGWNEAALEVERVMQAVESDAK